MLRHFMAHGVEGSSGDGAAPKLIGAKLTNTGLVDPLIYGDAMIGLSGIYAITNAFRLAIAHKRQLTRGEAHAIMFDGFRYLSGRVTPAQAFQSGCRVSLWRSMAQAMVGAACRRLRIHAAVERLFIAESGDRAAAFSNIEQAIMHWCPVLMLCRGGRYTVVCGFTSSSLLLFDGEGARWLSKHACGVPGDGENARHMLYPASFMALSA